MISLYNNIMKKILILLLFSLNIFPEVFPKLELKPLKNSEMISFDSLKEEYILVNFWASWCIPCRIELPEIEKLQKEYKGNKLKIIAISLDDEKKKAEDFLKKFDISLPFYYLEKKYHSSLLISGIPANFLINSNMEVLKKWEGYDPSIIKEIKKIVGK